MKIILVDRKGFTKELEGEATNNFTWVYIYGEVEFKLYDIKNNIATYHETVDNQ